MDAWAEVNDTSDLDSFIVGFRLGASFAYVVFATILRLSEGELMMEKKYYIALDDFERRVVVNCMNEMRNRLITEGKYTDAVDDVLLKIIDAKTKKFKVICKEG